MLRTTLTLTKWLACFSASSGGVLSAVTWSCFELFNYLLHENRQEVMQKCRIFVPKPRIARNVMAAVAAPNAFGADLGKSAM